MKIKKFLEDSKKYLGVDMPNKPMPDEVVIEARILKWGKGYENSQIYDHYEGKYSRSAISDCIYNRTFKNIPMPKGYVPPYMLRPANKAEKVDIPKPVCSDHACSECGEMFLDLHVAGKDRLCDWCYEQYQIDKQDALDIARRVAAQRKKEREKLAYETLGHVKTWIYNELKDYRPA